MQIISTLNWIRQKISSIGTRLKSKQDYYHSSTNNNSASSGNASNSTNMNCQPTKQTEQKKSSTKHSNPSKPIKIALFAGPGAGKTTLALGFTAHMKDKGFNWHYIHEYARDFIDVYGNDAIKSSGPLLQTLFMDKQIRLEKKPPAIADGWITDSPVFLSWIYGARNSKAEEGDVETYIALKNCYKGFLRSLGEYDLIVRVVREKDYIQDGVRSQTEEEARDLDAIITSLLDLHNVTYHTISGTLEQRCAMLEQLVAVTKETGDCCDQEHTECHTT